MSTKKKTRKQTTRTQVGPTHGYGLRQAEGTAPPMFVVVRMEGGKDGPPLTKPERRGLAIEMLIDRVENDKWR